MPDHHGQVGVQYTWVEEGAEEARLAQDRERSHLFSLPFLDQLFAPQPLERQPLSLSEAYFSSLSCLPISPFLPLSPSPPLLCRVSLVRRQEQAEAR